MVKKTDMAKKLLATAVAAAVAGSMSTVAYAVDATTGAADDSTATVADAGATSDEDAASSNATADTDTSTDGSADGGDGSTDPEPDPDPTPEPVTYELDSSNTKITLAKTRYLYSKGKKFQPKVTVTYDGNKLAASNYKVSYVADHDGTYKAVSKVNTPGTFAVKIEGKGSYTGTVYSKSYQVDGVTYAAHASKWSSSIKQGNVAKSGGKNLNAIRISIAKKGLSGTVKYKVLKGSTWTGYVGSGSIAGNKSTSIQAIKVKLTGQLAKKYTVYYRVKVSKYGWMGWAKNSAKAGTYNLGSKVVAYKVLLKKRGASAPGYDNLAYVSSGSNGAQRLAMRSKIYNKASSTKYTIVCSTTYNKVAVFKGSKGDWRLIKFWSCCTGAYGSPTVKGNFTVGGKTYHFGEEKGYTCWYATSFYGNYLFHSVLYVPGSKSSYVDGSLGYNISHGCVRLAIANAKWIYSTIPSGTHVYVYGAV